MILFCGVVVHEQLSVFPKLRVKGKTQQSFFILVICIHAAVLDIQEYRGLFAVLVIRKGADHPFLLCHENAIGSITRMSHHDGATEVQIWKRPFG